MTTLQSISSLLGFRLILVVICFTQSGCSEGLGLREVDRESWFERENRSALSASSLSERTIQFLRREAYAERYVASVLSVIETLHARLVKQGERIVAFHLAEICYLQARSHEHGSDAAGELYLSVAEYAYAYLFDAKLSPKPNSFDPIFLWSTDLYNQALAEIVKRMIAGKRLRRGEARVQSLIGEVQLVLDSEFSENLSEDDTILVSRDYEVVGIPGSSLAYGLGVPLIFARGAKNIEKAEELVTRENLERAAEVAKKAAEVRQIYAVSCIAQFEGSICDGTSLRHATVNFFNPMRTSEVTLEGQTVPLEADLTMPLAYAVHTATKRSGLWALLRPGDETSMPTGLYMLQPYQDDRIPVILVHGLMSSPLTWLPLLNDLLSDPKLRKTYQFWFFRYPTGNPILFSASTLREALIDARKLYDPEQTNPIFNNAVIVGHSMGGLLTKLMLLSSEGRLWARVSDKSIDELDLSKETKDLLRRATDFEKLPFANRRVVFMATPHRGADMATTWWARIGHSLISLPQKINQAQEELRSRLRENLELQQLRSSGIANLEPEGILETEVIKWPYPSNLQIHSIIGNLEAADTPAGTDGVVPYKSAHLNEARSEKIIRSGHNVQTRPEAFVELRRILYLHLQELENVGDGTE